MKKVISLCFTLLLAVGGIAQSDTQWTLQSCMQYALDNNIRIKQTELDQESAAIERKSAIGNFLPRLNGSASNNWNSGLTQNITTGILETQTIRNSSYSVAAGVRLYGGKANIHTLDRADLSKIAADYNVAKLKDDMALNVAVSYLGVLLNKENSKLLEAQNIVTQEQIAQTQLLVDAGVLPRGDLLEIQATHAGEQQRIVVAKNAITISLINLAQLLNIKDYKSFDIAEQEYNLMGEEVLATTPEAILDKAKTSRYDLKIAEQNIVIAKKDLQLSKSSLLPTLDGFFNYNTREQGGAVRFNQGVDLVNPFSTQVIGQVEGTGTNVLAQVPNAVVTTQDLGFVEQLYLNDGVSYGISLNVPVFNGWSVKNQIKRGEINLRQLEFAKEQATLDLETAVYQAYTDAKAAKEAYAAAQTAVTSQDLAYDYAKERYNNGLVNAFGFSQAKLRYDNAQIELTRSKYDYIFRIKVLELYFGVPVIALKF